MLQKHPNMKTCYLQLRSYLHRESPKRMTWVTTLNSTYQQQRLWTCRISMAPCASRQQYAVVPHTWVHTGMAQYAHACGSSRTSAIGTLKCVTTTVQGTNSKCSGPVASAWHSGTCECNTQRCHILRCTGPISTTIAAAIQSLSSWQLELYDSPPS